MAVKDALRRLAGQKSVQPRNDPPGLPEPIFNPVAYSWYFDQILGMSESEMWRTQPQLRTVVTFLARNIAQLGLQTFAKQSDNDRTRLLGAQSALLLSRPNPQMTGYDLVYNLVADLALYDKAYWYVTTDASWSSCGRRLTRIPPTWVIGMHPAGLFGVKEFIIQPNTGQSSVQSRLPADKVIYFHGWNPDDPKFGDSPVSALRETLAEQMAAQEFRNQNWRNGGRLNGVIERPDSAPDWSDGAKRKFKKGWKDAYSGRQGSDAGGVPILEEGMTYKSVGFSAADNQFVEAAKLSLGTVCGVYHVNPIMVGDNQGSNYCLPADAQVYTTVGPKRIADVTTDDRVWSLEDGQVTDKSVTWSGQTGVMPLLTLRTQNRTLRCTANHPVLVRRKVRIKPDKMRYRWEHAYVPAGELAVGDILVTLNELPDRGGSHSPTREVCEQFAEFYGLMVGDGSITGNCVQVARAADAPYMDYYRRVIADEFTVLTRDKRGTATPTLTESSRSTVFKSKSTAAELRALGFANGSRTKRVPSWVFELSPKLRAAFLRGYGDADGSFTKKGYIEFKASSPGLIDDMRHLCIGLGVPVTNISRVDRMTTLPGGKWCRNELWCFVACDPGANQIIGTNDPQDQARLAGGKPWGRRAYNYWERSGRIPIDPPAGCGHARVVSIKPDPIPVPVYDLTVDGEHNFVADGVVVHNSNVKEFRKALYGDTLGPICAQIEAIINIFLLPMIDEPPRNYVEFNINEKLQGNFEDQAIALQMAVGGPWMTRAEARALNNLPYTAGSDELITPLNVITGGQASPRDSAPAPGDRTGPGDSQPEQSPLRRPKDASLAAFIERQREAVVAKLGAGFGLDKAWNDRRWNDELADLLPNAEEVNEATKAALSDVLTEGYNVKRVDDVFSSAASRTS